MRNLTTPARPRRFFLPLWPALLVLALASGCRSTQVAYQFRPAPRPVAGAAPVAPSDSGAVAPAATAAAPEYRPAKLLARPARRQPRQPALRQLLAQSVSAHRVIRLPTRVATQSTQRVARPQQPAEVGLGTTVLGVLGLVVLPISLLGLLIWGGPVWAILAGLAALAVLIAYLDPFG